MISVIMPTTGRGFGIRRAVQSVLAQTYSDFELVIIADGCPKYKEIQALAAALRDPRIAAYYIEGPHNDWGAVARNCAIRHHAHGAHIAYLDDDNAWRPEFLEKLIQPLAAGECDVAYCSTAIWRLDGSFGGERRFHFDPDVILGCVGNGIDTSEVMHRAAVTASDECLWVSGPYATDMYTHARWIRAGFTFRHVDEILLDYTFRG